jgi:hypothetical protein
MAHNRPEAPQNCPRERFLPKKSVKISKGGLEAQKTLLVLLISPKDLQNQKGIPKKRNNPTSF